MLARLQRLIVFSLLLTAVVIAALPAYFGMYGLAAIAAGVVVGNYALILAVELVCLWHVEVPGSRPSLTDLFRAWCGEVVTTPPVFFWRQPFRSRAVEDYLPGGPPGRRGVVMVHGLVCNRGFWNPWLTQLRRLGHPCLAIDLEPVFGSIEAYGDAIERGVARVWADTGVAPVIVAHSMGGLAVRHWLRTSGSSHRIHRIITIGTPHHGTWLARFARSDNGRQMVVGSAWLSSLAAHEGLRVYGNFTCFYGSCDNIVFPSTNACLPGADNRLIGRTAHVALAFKKEVFGEVLRWLESTPSNADQ